jgi:outer membrane protein assembly factor BamB
VKFKNRSRIRRSYGFRQQDRFRHRRRFNPARGILSLLLVAAIGAFLFFTGRALFGANGLLVKDGALDLGGLFATGTAGSPAGSKTPSPSGGSKGTGSTSGTGGSSEDGTVSTEPTPTPEPTPRPTPEPMTPESTDPSVIRMSWEDPSVFDGSRAFPEAAIQNASAGGSMTTWVFRDNKPAKDPGSSVDFGPSAQYADIGGVLAFRGNNWRNAPSAGTRAVTEKKLEIVWTSTTGAISTSESYWPGTGWTGQPLLVHWPEATRKAMNLSAEAKAKDLVEVVYPTLDGNIYFLDLETGKPTRKKIEVGFPFKGTGVIDPRGFPILYTGQGLNENGKKVTDFKFHIFNLLDQTEIYGILGRDPVAFRPWGAFDSSGLVDASSDTLVECGENGLVYKVKLNTLYDAATKSLELSPQLTKYRYHLAGNDELGIESSPAAYRNFLYFCDNGGVLQCLDLNTMKPVWFTETGDDTDCTTTLEETPEGVFIYTANEIDKRSEGGKVPVADCNIRKYDAMTGRMIWQADVPCIYQYYINGGALATPLIGKDDIAGLVIFNIALTGNSQSGKLLALDKATGKTVWERNLASYSWSSPVDLLSQDGKTYGLFCDFSGLMHLFDPKTGKDLDTVSLGGNIESSPAVYRDMIVVGSYAKKLFGIRIR